MTANVFAAADRVRELIAERYGADQHRGVSVTPSGDAPRPFSELSDFGLLWLINTTVFHPRGYALALVREADGTVSGWHLLGDGTEAFTFADADAQEELAKVRTTLEAGQPTTVRLDGRAVFQAIRQQRGAQ